MPDQRIERARSGIDRGINFGHPSVADGRAMWVLAQDAGLDVNSPYAYVMWAGYHAETTVLARVGADVAGFVLGFRVPAEPDTVFVWQIAVAARWRGLELGSRLLDELVQRTGARCIEATVVPSNGASAAMFRSLGRRHGTTAVEQPGFGGELFPDGHEEEIRFRVPTPGLGAN